MRGPGAVFPAWLRAIGAAALAPAVAVALALLGAPLPARALGPHEVALLVNEAAPGSAELAAAWARLRGVPAANVVRVSVPPGPDGAPPVAITKEDFVSRVWEPARAQLAAAGVAPHVLAWVYSSGFPARVADTPATLGRAGTNDLSIAGATFLRARWPERPDATVAGVDGSAPLYVSPLFAGPAGAGGAVRPSEALDQSRNALLDAMPLPAAMLAWTGPRGQTPEEALAALERAAAADATLPAGAFFVRLRPGDPRSDAREWEFEEAAAALRSRGAAVEVSTNAPAEALGPLAGYLDGARAVDPLPALAPGAFADHFTSFAAAFDQPTSDLRKGLKLRYEGQPYTITEYSFTKPGKGQSIYTCRLKHMLTGNTFVKNFREIDTFDELDLEEKTVNFSYEDGDQFVFLDADSEQINVPADILGDKK